MLADLKRYNSIGDVQGISYFAQVVLKDVCVLEQAARDLCALNQNIRLNFDAAKLFFSYLGWLDAAEGMLSVTERGREGVAASSVGYALCRCCVRSILNDKIVDSTAISYDISKESFVIQRFAFPVSAALFRNVLLQYGALKESDCGLLVSHEYESLFADEARKHARKMSIDRLKQIQEKEAEQGEAGELFVLEFEKNRIGDPTSAERIKRVSEIDVAAGYDIVSLSSRDAKAVDRFIEVKTYRGRRHFFWSANEIEASRLYGDKYMIALVDYDKIGVDGYEPTFIADPIKNVKESSDWIMTPTSFAVAPTGE